MIPRARPLLPLLLLCAFFACAKDYTDLAPFPCPDDHQCPAGLACVPGAGCTAPTLDAWCSADTACTAAAAAAACGLGLCLPPCTDGAGCPPDRVCTASDGPGFCARACTTTSSPSTTTSCPDGLACTALFRDNLRACLPPATTFPSCDGVVADAQCPVPPARCGDVTFTVACPAGGRCTERSTCVDGTAATCRCDPGTEAVHCDGTPCNTAHPCAWPDWACRPRAAPGCDDPLGTIDGTCRCRDGRDLPVTCTTTASCDALCRA